MDNVNYTCSLCENYDIANYTIFIVMLKMWTKPNELKNTQSKCSKLYLGIIHIYTYVYKYIPTVRRMDSIFNLTSVLIASTE